MRAFVTLLSNERYFEGVVMLHRSLKAVGSENPLYCMLSASVAGTLERRLNEAGVPCIRLQKSVVADGINADGREFPHWSHTFDKLQMWGLTQFEKIVFIDSDMLIRSNIDSLFDRPPFTAVCAGCSYPANGHWYGLNSGLLVVEPNKEIGVALYAMVPKVIEEFVSKGMPVGDQDVINRYLSDWYLRKDLHLDEGYNMFADYLSYYIRHKGYSWTGRNGKPIHIVHFIGRQKPWMKKGWRNWAWLIRECIRNPYYFLAYTKYVSYLRR